MLLREFGSATVDQLAFRHFCLALKTGFASQDKQKPGQWPGLKERGVLHDCSAFIVSSFID